MLPVKRPPSGRQDRFCCRNNPAPATSNLVHQENAAVAAPTWPSAPTGRRFAKLDVELRVAKLLRAHNVAFGRSHGPVFQSPWRRIAFLVAPLRKVFSVKQHDGIGWRFSRLVLCAEGARSNDDRLRPLRIMDMPFAAWLQRRVLVARYPSDHNFSVGNDGIAKSPRCHHATGRGKGWCVSCR